MMVNRPLSSSTIALISPAKSLNSSLSRKVTRQLRSPLLI
jgi:hypothetical protein